MSKSLRKNSEVPWFYFIVGNVKEGGFARSRSGFNKYTALFPLICEVRLHFDKGF